MGRGGTPARETSFVSLVAYGPTSDSALIMRGYSLCNQAGRFPPKNKMKQKNSRNKFSVKFVFQIKKKKF